MMVSNNKNIYRKIGILTKIKAFTTFSKQTLSPKCGLPIEPIFGKNYVEYIDEFSSNIGFSKLYCYKYY